MNGFADHLMVRYLQPEHVASLLVPQDDPDRHRLRSLLAAVYEPALLEVRFVDSVTVTGTSFQVPVSAPVTVRGSWEKLLPDIAQARATLDIPAVAPVHWIDLALETVVSARVTLTSGALDALDSEDLSGLSEDEFVAKFGFLDLADLMRRAKAADYGELQAQFPRLYRLHYADAPPFDPDAPGRTYRLRISVLFFPDLDLGAALRRLVQCRRALDDTRPRPDEYDGGALLAASAWLAVFPAAALSSDTAPVTGQQVSDLLAAEGFVAAFEDVA
ncbi:hypothetical protein HEK616_43550 [Streptomyces nigrescens]|uniref:Uncharacterized protein n=1 Tax=Streptomyces nigrescens TaxID=1920 RepID=A0ABM7ZWY6_STRNI|nr:hypothetical protein [Streptomyces nigrescens]BDM70868.1 hypothetical protein HEK616_43550 [Streptomyces nigrescens]